MMMTYCINDLDDERISIAILRNVLGSSGVCLLEKAWACECQTMHTRVSTWQ